MGVAYALFGADVSIFASLSALLIVLSERGGTTGQRLLRSGAGLAAGTVAQLFGPLTGGTGWLPLVTVLTFGLLSGVMSGVGPALSWAAMQLLVQMAIAGGLQVELPHSYRVMAYVAGGIIALAAMLLQSVLERTDRLYSSALEQAEQSLASWAAIASGVDRTLRAKANADLLAATELVLLAHPIRRRRKALIRRAREKLTDLAWRSQLLESCTAAAVSTSRTFPPPIRAISPFSALRQGIKAGSTWEFALRLECCLLLGELVRQVLPVGHGYWVLLTIALVLKPDIQSVFSRTLQRGIGTLLGVCLAWIPTLLAPGIVIFPLIAALSAPIPWAVRRNYGIFCVLVTPLVLLILDFGGTVSFGVVVERVVDTAIGCLIVLAVGFAIWPTTWHPRPDQTITTVIRDLSVYTTLGTDDWKAAEQRLQTLMSIQALNRLVDRAESEPRAIRARLTFVSEISSAADSVLAAVAPLNDPASRSRASARLRQLSAGRGTCDTPGDSTARTTPWEVAIRRLEEATARRTPSER
jgi:hypothetical protein